MKINRNPKYFMFRTPVDTEEVGNSLFGSLTITFELFALYFPKVYDYLSIVKEPMDFDKMQTKLDDGDYKCAKDFLDDIDLIAENAISYNSDLKYETNKVICHRARDLQDFAYALIKAEMDTDFEEECRDIVSRRQKLTKELEERDTDGEEEAAGGSDANDANSSITQSGRKRKRARMRVSKWAKGFSATRARRRPKRGEDGEEEEEEEEDHEEQNGEEHNEEEEEEAMETEEALPDAGGRSTRRRSRTVSNGESAAAGSSARSSPKENALAPTSAANSSSSSSMVPTGGVRIDQKKLDVLHNQVTHLTEGYNVERLERVHSLLMGVVAKFATVADRTQLPAEMKVQIDALKAPVRPQLHSRH